MKNVDTFPIPDYHLIHQKYYRRHKGPSAVVVTSRGCPFECSYCCMGKASPIQYRRKSVTTVVEEIKTAVITHGVRFIDFEDENFALDRLWVTELLDRLQPLISEYPAELRAMNGLYPPSLDNAIICKMKAAGFKAVNLSLGSFCPRQLKRFGRHDFVDHFDRVVHSAVANGLDCIAYIIAGAPGQSADLSLEDLLQLSKRAVLAGLSIFYPAPGSYDYQVCLSKKILPERKTLWRSSAMPISDCSSRDETVTLMRLARILNFLKALHQNGEPRPKPYLVRNQRVNFADNRKAIGRYLLSGFLSDGKIRGCTPKGVVYEHATVDRLALRFLNEFNKSKLNQIEPAKLY
jgi:radical SAM superfamily enzyme YgiQ (UPF0313 family)